MRAWTQQKTKPNDVECPACESRFPSLERLDFHLNFACLSRKKERRTEDEESAAVVVVDDDDDNKVDSCPSCAKPVKLDELNLHLDHHCRGGGIRPASRSSLMVPPFLPPPLRVPPGLVVIENFITDQEERELVQSLLEDTSKWKPSSRNGPSLYRHWGTVIDYTSGGLPRCRPPKMGEEPMPRFLQLVIDRFKAHDSTSANWNPNNCNAQQYVKSKGHHLTAHYDDRRLSGEIICNVSLLSDCYMTFKRGEVSFRVKLPRLSASVMTRSARYDYTHEIALEDFCGERRISLNFRQQNAT